MTKLIGLVIALCGWGMGIFFLGVSVYAMGGAVVQMNTTLFFDGIVCLLLGFVTWWVLVSLASLYGIPKPRFSTRRKRR